MSGTFTPKVLYEGQLPNTKTTLYTVPASTKAYISSMNGYNTNTTTETVLIYYKPGSTSRVQYRAALVQDGSMKVGPGDVLEAGDIIEGETTTATKVDFVIMGVEET